MCLAATNSLVELPVKWSFCLAKLPRNDDTTSIARLKRFAVGECYFVANPSHAARRPTRR
jgi:hypothetical protein